MHSRGSAFPGDTQVEWQHGAGQGRGQQRCSSDQRQGMNQQITGDRSAPPSRFDPSAERFSRIVEWKESNVANQQSQNAQGCSGQDTRLERAGRNPSGRRSATQHQQGVGRIFPGIDGPKAAHGNRQGNHRDPRPGTAMAAFCETYQQGETQGQRENRKGHGHHVGVEVRKQKSEERELGDVERGFNVAVGSQPRRQDRRSEFRGFGYRTTAAPEIKAGPRGNHTGGFALGNFDQLDESVEIANNHGHQGGADPGKKWADAADAPTLNNRPQPSSHATILGVTRWRFFG